MIDTSNYWIGDFILGPILILLMLGTAFWYAYRKEEQRERIMKSHTCDDSCHGSNDNYTYANFTALQAAHALEQRVTKIEYRLAKSLGNFKGNGFLDGEVILTNNNNEEIK
jgi:hypothetical protein